MRNRRQHLFMGVVAAAVVSAPLSAMAVSGGMYSAELEPVPHSATADGGSNVTGHSDIKLRGRTIDVSLHATGLTPGEPHAMHIHGVLDRVNECPPAAADVNSGDPIDPDNHDHPFVEGTPDGLISLTEGDPFYGPIDVSLTETGSTAPGAGLNLEQFATADSAGTLTYERTIKVSKRVAKNLGNLHIVLHGADLPEDEDASSLSSLFEATLPVACGQIDRSPTTGS